MNTVIMLWNSWLGYVLSIYFGDILWCPIQATRHTSTNCDRSARGVGNGTHVAASMISMTSTAAGIKLVKVSAVRAIAVGLPFGPLSSGGRVSCKARTSCGTRKRTWA